MHYNEALADRQGLTETQRLELDVTYELLFDALENPEKYDNVEDTVRDLEFRLQRQWKFVESAKYHRYQLEIKGCTCPKLDNYELIGHTPDRYRVSDCPWHWSAADQEASDKAYEVMKNMKREEGV